MRLLLRLSIVILFAFTFYFLLFIKFAYAQGEFEADYDVSYTVEPDGRTNVNQKIILKNKTSDYYADKFELKIGSTKVEDVKAFDNVGPLETEVKFDEIGRAHV